MRATDALSAPKETDSTHRQGRFPLPGRLTGRSELDAPLANRHNDEFLSILPPDVEYRLAATLLELNTGIGLPKMLFASCCSRHGRTGTARRCKRSFGPALGHGHVGFSLEANDAASDCHFTDAPTTARSGQRPTSR
jgi:hypothetical protein